MKKALALSCLFTLPIAHAETAPVQRPAPVAQKPAVAPAPVKPAPAPVPAPAKPAAVAPVPARTVAPAPAAAKPAAAVAAPAAARATPVVTPAAPAVQPQVPATEAAPQQPPAPAPMTLEQRRQIELLANAERIDKANRELLAKNQELQLQNENLAMQINVIRHDRSSEGIWKGALAVIAGFLMGWFFANGGRRKSSW
ncbi:MAG: hypothetical protein K0Q68_1043 [Moraxellaceae bacterium]|jgi:hypothetical protein|nr:hypothetical protein [Moraxellaceae bacterium]